MGHDAMIVDDTPQTILERDVQKGDSNALKEELRCAREEVQHLQTKVRQEQSRGVRYRTRAEELEFNVGKRDARILDLEKQLQGYNRVIAKAREVETRGKQMETELDTLRKQLNDNNALLKTRTSELQDAQTYLSSTDDLSHADVQRKLNTLNSEISQIAPRIADCLQFTGGQGGNDEIDLAGRRATVFLGTALVELLKRVDHQEDSLAVQMALQACFVDYCAWLSRRSTWDPTAIDDVNTVLESKFMLNRNPISRRTVAHFGTTSHWQFLGRT